MKIKTEKYLKCKKCGEKRIYPHIAPAGDIGFVRCFNNCYNGEYGYLGKQQWHIITKKWVTVEDYNNFKEEVIRIAQTYMSNDDCELFKKELLDSEREEKTYVVPNTKAGKVAGQVINSLFKEHLEREDVDDN